MEGEQPARSHDWVPSSREKEPVHWKRKEPQRKEPVPSVPSVWKREHLQTNREAIVENRPKGPLSKCHSSLSPASSVCTTQWRASVLSRREKEPEKEPVPW